jgi:hypothetical protein
MSALLLPCHYTTFVCGTTEQSSDSLHYAKEDAVQVLLIYSVHVVSHY